MADKKRLDIMVVEAGLAPSREKARALIMAGNVLVNDVPATKAGEKIKVDSNLRVRGGVSKYVSRGGEKMEGALADLCVDVSGLHVVDLGASTGGFTDCLLQHGAATVCAVDVGYGQLAMKLRTDPRVSVLEKTNARHVGPGDFERLFDLVSMDLSFISLLKVLPAAGELLEAGGRVVALVKPQFEAGRENVGKGGVVKDPAAHVEVLKNVIEGANEMGFVTISLCFSRIKGPKGNIEYFVLLQKDSKAHEQPDIEKIVHNAMDELNP